MLYAAYGRVVIRPRPQLPCYGQLRLTNLSRLGDANDFFVNEFVRSFFSQSSLQTPPVEVHPKMRK